MTPAEQPESHDSLPVTWQQGSTPPRVLIACGDEAVSRAIVAALVAARFAADADGLEVKVPSPGTHDAPELAGCEIVQTLSLLHAVPLQRFDVVFCTAALPDATAIDVLAYIRGTVPDMPVIVMGQTGDVDLAAEAIRCGAVEFLLVTGHEMVTAPLAVEKAFTHRRLRRENEQLQESLSRSMSELAVTNRKLERSIRQLEVTARTDELTGLVNRRWLNLMLEGRWAEAERHELSLGFMMIDLDGFKALNDTLGHQQGDEVLKAMGDLLQYACREIDVAARFGGDEFCVLLPHTDVDAACRVAARIVEAFHVRMERLDLGAACPGISIGIGHRDLSQPRAAEDLVRHADEAMYAAKTAGKQVMVKTAAGHMVDRIGNNAA
ncbi:MAG: diguanylate cyclase [Phycisphaerales bacterium]|nr:diguanylate cyclase [Phycisphaerales bacterium]